jgi:GNAT superfamily N-acetyltransferase
MLTDFVVVQDHPDMLIYIDGLQKKNAESLSFYPTQVFEREKDKGRLFLGLLNGQPCGYIYVGAQGTTVKCHQVCIQYDARLSKYGAALVSALEEYANNGNATSVSLRCGFDIDANKFWKVLGYQVVSIVDGGVRRMRKINVWRKQLLPELFETIGLEPAVGKTNSTVWRKNKQTGLITGFNRGRLLSQYRQIIITEKA